MLHLLSARDHEKFRVWLSEMHRLRYRVFKERLGWSVETIDDLEIDRFDDIGPSYIIYLDGQSTIRGCVRLLPSTGPYMLRDVFAELSDPEKIPNDPTIWESSRFALDVVNAIGSPLTQGLSPTLQLFLGMIEFGLSRGLKGIVTVTDTRIERILRRANWPFHRLGTAKRIGQTEAVAGILEISTEALQKVRATAGISFPVLWAPVLGSHT